MTIRAYRNVLRSVLGRCTTPLANGRWLTEEVGELARALRRDEPDELRHEFSDVLAWLTSLANLAGVDVEDAASRFGDGCPKGGRSPCACAFVA